ncbi:hypothetical protein B0A70_06910 [Chryseobacterium piscicola]|uniref:Uncharacterized protein n=1 Tax=Chryseobacterium piscicola TaxID=551459 RepID=A0A2S7KG74_9FLAO|nr:hypothetical protein B0A70_06910 [Chryseobacterium piscicola]
MLILGNSTQFPFANSFYNLHLYIIEIFGNLLFLLHIIHFRYFQIHKLKKTHFYEVSLFILTIQIIL